MPVNVDGHLDRRMAELVAHVGERLPLRDEERGVGVSQIVESHMPEPRLLETPQKVPLPYVGLVEMIAVAVIEEPLGLLPPSVLERLLLRLDQMPFQDVRELV